MTDWKQQRIGPNPPQVLASLRTDAAQAVLAACSVHPALVMPGDSTGQREAWRQFKMGSVEPVSRIVACEQGWKLDVPGLSFDFTRLWGHDLAGCAASFAKMIQGGMDLKRAASLSGLAVGDERARQSTMLRRCGARTGRRDVSG